MPVNEKALIQISAMSWVPDFAKGLVRDLRVRWALEEAGRGYCVRLLDPRQPKPADYLNDQPFGQVPTYSEGGITLFESGAILLRIARDCDTLLPREEGARQRATTWLFAALNSVEPPIVQLSTLNLTQSQKPWAEEYRPFLVEMVGKRLDAVEKSLGDKKWLDGAFSVGDLMMATVLRILRSTDHVANRPRLAAYLARAEARPAFQQALADQMAGFTT